MFFDDGDQTARFFYLALLGAAIAWGVFTSQQHRLSKSLRDAAIWVLIFATAILLYGFKDQFRAQLYPGEPRMVGDRTIALGRQTDGHFHAELLINGQSVRALVDTGASSMVLTRADAAKAGLDLDNLNFFGRAQTANGTVSTAPVTLNRVQLGEVIDYDVPASVNGGELGVSLLGLSYLDRFQSWRVEGDTMILQR